MTLDWRVARIAKNEASFRDINERLEQGLRQVRDLPDLLEFVCECGDRECGRLVSLTLEEYEAVRRDSRYFAVVAGHVFPDTERVVEDHGRFQVIEKLGGAIPIVEEADDRNPGS